MSGNNTQDDEETKANEAAIKALLEQATACREAAEAAAALAKVEREAAKISADAANTALNSIPTSARKSGGLHTVANWFEDWHLARIMNAINGFAILIAVVVFVIEMSDRTDERVARAWQILTTTAPGNSGKREALEYLNSESLAPFHYILKTRTPLVGIDLSSDRHNQQVFLQSVDLRSGDLKNSEFSGAMLKDADFSNADLWYAQFRGSILYGADFTNAGLNGASFENAKSDNAIFRSADLNTVDFTKADLYGADFSAADLSNTVLHGTDLRDAKLHKVKGLTAYQIKHACIDDNTLLPQELEKHRPKPCRLDTKGNLHRDWEETQ